MAVVTKENKIEIIGTLESISREVKTTEKLGTYVRGDMVIKVVAPTTMNIPISFFCKQITNDGKPRKLFDQLNALNVGQRMNITGQIQDNKFWSTASGDLIKTKRLGINFINAVRDTDKDKAEFVFSGFVYEPLKEKYDSEQNLLHYSIKMAQETYNKDRCQVIEFVIKPDNMKAASYVAAEFQAGRSFRINGLLDFDVKTETRKQEVDFGEPIITTYQRNISNLVVIGGSQISEGAYEFAHIDQLKSGDKADDERVIFEAKNKEQTGEIENKPKPVNTKAVAESLL